MGQCLLHEFVTDKVEFLRIFKIFDISTDLFNEEVSTWKELPDYLEAQRQRKITALAVINDNAERGIALIKTYNSELSTNENQKQCILQIVEEHRNTFKSPDKKAIVTAYNK